ncbi:MAG: hypothetical protein JST93_09880 [Acidobacteria bacterium]|nr:hypothetical protein [Acidobacteriota bacterium]
MKIPQNPVDLKAYHQAIIDALADAAVPIYLDTSFLMWLLQAGDGIRAELLQWLRNVGTGRVVIPTWSAHELYRHINSQKVLTELQGRLKQYTAGFGQALIELSVSADDSLCENTSFNDRAHLLQSLRADFVRLQGQLSAVLDKNKIQAQYQRALEEIIAFVNDHVATTNPFKTFEEISISKDLRFSGKVPPGFKDEGKEGKGDNSCGDLVFWQEVLADLEPKKRKTAVIITNDNKSDWHYKPKLLLNYKGERKPVLPHIGLEARLPHPLLEHEAQCKAGVERMVIVDVNILSVVLDKIDASSVKILVAATHPPLLDRDEKGVNWNVIDPTGAGSTTPAAPVVTSAPSVAQQATSGSATATATPTVPPPLSPIHDEAAQTGDFGILLSQLAGELDDRTAAFDKVSALPFLRQLTKEELVLLGRRVYRSAATKGSPADVRLSELLQTARALDVPERNALAIGMFAELYFDETGAVRDTPMDGPWQTLFDLQYEEEFKEAIDQIAEMLSPVKDRLIIVPSSNPQTIAIDIQLVKNPEKGPRLLDSVIVGGKQVLGDVLPGTESALTSLIGNPPSTVGAVLRAVSRRFLIPLRQLDSNKEDGLGLSWTEDAGLHLLRLAQGGVCDELSLSLEEEEA